MGGDGGRVDLRRARRVAGDWLLAAGCWLPCPSAWSVRPSTTAIFPSSCPPLSPLTLSGHASVYIDALSPASFFVSSNSVCFDICPHFLLYLFSSPVYFCPAPRLAGPIVPLCTLLPIVVAIWNKITSSIISSLVDRRNDLPYPHHVSKSDCLACFE